MIGEYWIAVKDNDPRVVDLYNRHYSARKSTTKESRLRHGISGVGQSLILLTQDCRALFGWLRNTIERYDNQEGINCFVFRNESELLSSILIKEADEWAWNKWGEQRLFTYVNADKIRKKRDPGRCFVKAGWRKCGISKGGLILLEHLPGK